MVLLELKQLTIQKKQAHRRYKISGLGSDYLNFSRLRSECKNLSQLCYLQFVENSEISLTDQKNIKQFWNFVRSKRSGNELPPLLFFNDKQCSLVPDQPDLFAEYFQSVYSDKCVNPQSKSSFNCSCICDYNIPISTIYEQMVNIDINKGPGPDGIPPSVLKSCSFVLSRPLHIIFNKSLASGIFPDFWKVSYLIPIFKSGNRADISNYRPICNLSSIPKLFENGGRVFKIKIEFIHNGGTVWVPQQKICEVEFDHFC